MPGATPAGASLNRERDVLKLGVSLLSQQIWCWGRDILRPEGNWLLDRGFDRIEAPADRDGCASVYRLEMPAGRRVVLRGFGVFYGDDRLGGVFLPRYEFRPLFTPSAKLDCPPWLDSDLPELSGPNESQRDACASLTVDLLDWVRSYEADVAERLGIAYRLETLGKWDNGKRPVTPAAEMVGAWQALGEAIGALRLG